MKGLFKYKSYEISYTKLSKKSDSFLEFSLLRKFLLWKSSCSEEALAWKKYTCLERVFVTKIRKKQLLHTIRYSENNLSTKKQLLEIAALISIDATLEMAALISIQSMLLWKYRYLDNKFVFRWLVFWNTLKGSGLPNWITANLKVRKMHSAVGRMDGYKYSKK